MKYPTSQRPENFTINPQVDLGRGLMFFGGGACPGSAKLIDSSGLGNNATLTNMAIPATATSGWQWDNFLRRWVLAFDGSNDYVQAVGNNSTAFTAACWVKIAATTTTTQIYLEYSASNNLRYGLGSYAGGYPFVPRLNVGSPYKVASSSTFVTGKWYHFAGTSDGSNYAMYINGVSVAITGSSTSSCDTASVLRIGQGCSTASNYSNSSIGDPCIWNRVLSPYEIAQEADPVWSIMKGGLILPPRRRSYAAAVAGTTFNPTWAMNSNQLIA